MFIWRSLAPIRSIRMIDRPGFSARFAIGVGLATAGRRPAVLCIDLSEPTAYFVMYFAIASSVLSSATIVGPQFFMAASSSKLSFP